MTLKLTKIFALMATLALVAAACGGDTEEGPPPPPETVVVTSIVTETETITETVEVEVEVEVEVPVEMENPLAGTTVTVFGPESSDAEAGSHQAALDIFAAQNGMTISYTGERSFSDLINAQAAGGNPPDIAVFPQPGKIADFAREGWLLPIPDDVLETMNANIGAAWNAFGNVDGVQYAIPTKADLKSLVWYRPADFSANGYAVPTTWGELKTLSQQMIDDGNVPWCIGIESGGATGWAFTDWVEDLTLRYQGADFYDEWVAHTIPFNTPEMNGIWTEILELWNTPGAVYAEGGTISSTFFGDNGRPLVEGDCMMHRQASFFSAFFPDGTAFGPDGVDVFYFPSVKGDRPVLGAGTLVAAFRDAPRGVGRHGVLRHRAVRRQPAAVPEPVQGWWSGTERVPVAQPQRRPEPVPAPGTVLPGHPVHRRGGPVRRFGPDAGRGRRRVVLDRVDQRGQRRQDSRGGDPGHRELVALSR